MRIVLRPTQEKGDFRSKRLHQAQGFLDWDGTGLWETGDEFGQSTDDLELLMHKGDNFDRQMR